MTTTENPTLKEWFDSALKCKTRDEADYWLAKQIVEASLREPEEPATVLRARIRENLGYFAGYYGRDVQRQVFELFDASHPILGTPDEIEKMTQEEIFQRGVDWAKSRKAE